jgi:small neutral amino acid transporter SnatA (MarC family)
MAINETDLAQGSTAQTTHVTLPVTDPSTENTLVQFPLATPVVVTGPGAMQYANGG